MKKLSKVIAFVLVFTMALCAIPALEAPASAASTPVLVLSATTAVNPILDHVLDFDTYSTGGPFTVEWEWKCELKANDPNDAQAFRTGVSVTGFIYGTTDVYQWDAGFEGYNPPRITGKTDWTKGSFQFQNVGTYPMTGTNIPGNILRFSLWKAKGSVYVKNLKITNAEGKVLYDLNTDAVVTQLVANMESMGLTEADISELAAIDYAHCPWVAGQFSTGTYSSSIQLEAGAEDNTTTSSVTRPTTTKPTTTKPTVAPSSSVSTQSTTAPVDSTDPTDPIIPTDPTDSVVPTAPTDPTTIPTTAAPTTAPAPTTQPGGEVEGNQDGGSKINPVVLIVAGVALAAVVGGAVIYFAVLKKKK